MNGYIWIYRKLLDWEWFREPNTLQLFICLVLRANWSDSKWKGIDVKRGQLITSVASLCEATGQTPRSIRTGINRLKSTGEVTIKTTNKYSLITVENWALYQPDKDETTNKTTSTTTNERQTNDKRTTTDEEYNKKEEEKEEVYTHDTDAVPTDDANELLQQEILSNGKVPYEKIQALWNDTVKSLPKIKSLTDGRKRLIKARYKDSDGVKSFKKVFEKVEQSDFLSGRNEAQWRGCGFDWVLKEANWLKIIEGNYDNKNKTGYKQPPLYPAEPNQEVRTGPQVPNYRSED